MNRNNKGFTLIELLAVIIILGILMTVAIPMMTGYIENSKKDAFWQTAKTYVNAARYGLLNDSYSDGAGGTCSLPPEGQVTIVPTSIVELEKGSTKSAWNSELDISYVACKNEGTDDKPKYVYYYAGMDQKKNGITLPTKEDALNRGQVKGGKAATAAQPGKGGSLPTVGGTIYQVCQ